jgi:hypothetical protein
MIDWMKTLAEHYAECVERFPTDRLLVVFDLEGTIYEERGLACAAAAAFDREHGTGFFEGVSPGEVGDEEGALEELVRSRGLEGAELAGVLAWCEEWRWSAEALVSARRARRGVMEVLRWFQLQPRTSVAVNTSRPESMRQETLASLNRLGEAWRVRFASDLLRMREDGEEDEGAAKADNLRAWRRRGFRVVAVVDEREEMIARMIPTHPSDTLFVKGSAISSTRGGARGYDLERLMGRGEVPERVRLVWNGAARPERLDALARSPVRWGECDVVFDGAFRLIATDLRAPAGERPEVPLERVLERALEAGKRMKLDLTRGGVMLDRVSALLRELGWPGDEVWINGEVDRFEREGFEALREAWPEATLQCPVDFLAPLAFGMPETARAITRSLEGWGVDRLSVDWKTPRGKELVGVLQGWDWSVNVFGVPDTEEFLRAALLLPESLTVELEAGAVGEVSAA